MSLIDFVCTGNVLKVQQALANGVDVNVRSKRGNSGTALHVASLWGHTKIVQLLLQSGADVHAVRTGVSDGATSLHLASNNGYLEIVRLLVAKHANMDFQDEDGYLI